MGFKLSVLISIYSKEKASNFNHCLLSIWDYQELKPDEIVIVEDGPLSRELYELIDSWKRKISCDIKVQLK